MWTLAIWTLCPLGLAVNLSVPPPPPGSDTPKALFPAAKFPVDSGEVGPGNPPRDLAIGDVDGDGVADLVVVTLDPGSLWPVMGGVSVLLGEGGGTFAPAQSFYAGREPLAAVISDLNLDGSPDLAVVNNDFGTSPNDVAVLLGVGDGGFGGIQTLSTGVRPNSVKAADLNLDGLPDLAVANEEDVAVLLGKGDGTFGVARTFGAGERPHSILASDLNRDGLPDLVVANSGTSDVSILLAEGEGVFGAPQSLGSGPGASTVAVEDLNLDGTPDLLFEGAGTASVLLGAGDGTFGLGKRFDVGAHALGPVIADMDLDGVPDFVITHGSEFKGTVSVWIGVGDGGFHPGRSFDAGWTPSAPHVSDFDGDGAPDVAVLNSASRDVAILLGVGDGTLVTAGSCVAGVGPESVAISDLNLDDAPDLIVASEGDGLEPGGMAVLLGVGDGTFGAADTVYSGGSIGTPVTGDLNLDGAPDLFFVHWNELTVLLGNGDGTFGAPSSTLAGPSPGTPAIGDLNLDGVPDIALARTAEVVVLLGCGDGTFARLDGFAADVINSSLAISDFDLDGVPDIAGSSSGGSDVVVLLGAGDGSFGVPQSFGEGPWSSSVVTGDLNLDGAPDLAFLRSERVTVLLGTGGGSFEGSRSFEAGETPRALVIGDLNLDGVPDLATTDWGTFDGPYYGDVHVLVGAGDGSFEPARKHGAGDTPAALAVGDLDLDGAPDLAVANTGPIVVPGSVSVLINEFSNDAGGRAPLD